MTSVLYAELRPSEFRQRLAQAPIAYLPLGTLEWHGEHLPLGSDGLEAQGFFEQLARQAGGIVLPMLFLGPDRRDTSGDIELYGMDICHHPGNMGYPDQQLAGSAYWVPDDVFFIILCNCLGQLARAGFRIVVAHGHGPSTSFFRDHEPEWAKRFGLRTFVCWGSPYDQQGLGLQVDHAAANETSLVMALRPELVDMRALPSDLDEWPLAVAGRDPRVHASPEVGVRALGLQEERMAGILRQALREL